MDEFPPLVDGAVWVLLEPNDQYFYLDAHVRYLLNEPDKQAAKDRVVYLAQLARDIQEGRIGGPHDGGPARVRRFRLWR